MRCAWLIPATLALTGCSPLPLASGTTAQLDVLAGASEATPVTPAIPVEAYEWGVALDANASRFAYASPSGVFVADVGGEAKKLADSGGLTRQIAWTADGKYVAFAEAEIPAKCNGNVCSSSSADDIYRVRLISVPDGKVTTVQEHVFGLHGLSTAARGNTFAYQGAEGGLTLLHPETGATETLLANEAFRNFAWSPDGDRIAFGSPNGGQAGGQLKVLELADRSVKRLADLGPGEGDTYLLMWRPDGRAVRQFSLGITTMTLLDHPVTGEPVLRDEFTLNDPNPEGDKGHGIWQSTPDGKWLVTTRQRDIHTRTALVALDPATHEIHRVGPAADWMTFAAASPTILARSGSYPNWKFYLLNLARKTT
jgi:hypothetical protein